jgi:hypothetical protein
VTDEWKRIWKEIDCGLFKDVRYVYFCVGRSDGIVRSRTEATEFVFVCLFLCIVSYCSTTDTG